MIYKRSIKPLYFKIYGLVDVVFAVVRRVVHACSAVFVVNFCNKCIIGESGSLTPLLLCMLSVLPQPLTFFLHSIAAPSAWKRGINTSNKAFFLLDSTVSLWYTTTQVNAGIHGSCSKVSSHSPGKQTEDRRKGFR